MISEPVTRVRRYTQVAAALLLALPITSTAQQVAPLPIEVVLQAKRLLAWDARPQFSADGAMLAYVSQDPYRHRTTPPEFFYQTGVPPSAIGSDIYVVNISDHQTRNLTREEGTNWTPSWSPDGKLLAFLSDGGANGQARLWLWERETGTVRKVSDTPLRTSRIQWLPDSRHVLVGTIPQGMTPEEFVSRVYRHDSGNTAQTKVQDATVVVYSSVAAPGPGSQSVSNANPVSGSNLDNALRDLALIDVVDGRVRSVDSGHRIHWYLCSPDGTLVLILSGMRYISAASQQVLFNVKTINLATMQERVLLRDAQIGHFGLAISWSPDSSHIAYWVAGGQDDGDYFVLDIAGKAFPRKVTEFSKPIKFRHDHSAPVWDLSGGNIYFFRGDSVLQAPVDRVAPQEIAKADGEEIIEIVRQNNNTLWSPDQARSAVILTQNISTKKNSLYRIDLGSGEKTSLILDGRCYTCMDQDPYIHVSPDGRRAAYFAGDARHPTDIWMIGGGFRTPIQLTHLNPELDRYVMGEPEDIEWLSLDGEQLHGALLLPAGYQKGRRYPLIVSVYGGARLSQSRSSFDAAIAGLAINPQLLATRGYAVLLPDAPLHAGTPMMDLAKTVLPGIDKAIAMEIVDPDRVGVMGHSYGGYSALSLIVQTKRFKAAAMIAGYGDLIAQYGAMGKDGTAYGASINEEGQGLMRGTPWQYRERFIENSPVFFLDRIETPLLIVHGEEDHGVPAFLADEVFVGLRRLGKETEYAKYEGEGHVPMAWWSYPNYLDFCKRLIDWFDSHLKGAAH